MLLYLVGNSAMLIAYWIIFACYMRVKKHPYALALAILPSCIFLMSGILLRHALLVCFALLFSIGHIYVTEKNFKAE